MIPDTKTPLALYKANLDLALRVGRLLSEHRRQWARQGLARVDEAVNRTLRESERALAAGDWEQLSKLPGDGFWASIQADADALQASTDAAIAQQSSFANGLQEAVDAWQAACGEAIREAGVALPTTTGFEDFLKVFTTATRPEVPPAAAATKAGPAAAAAKKPARRK